MRISKNKQYQFMEELIELWEMLRLIISFLCYQLLFSSFNNVNSIQCTDGDSIRCVMGCHNYCCMVQNLPIILSTLVQPYGTIISTHTCTLYLPPASVIYTFNTIHVLEGVHKKQSLFKVLATFDLPIALEPKASR